MSKTQLRVEPDSLLLAVSHPGLLVASFCFKHSSRTFCQLPGILIGYT